MSAKKSLEKLRKKVEKLNTPSAKKLKTIKRVGKQAQLKAVEAGAKSELRSLSEQAFSAALSELKTPITPILSWFDDAASLTPHLSLVDAAAPNPQRTIPTVVATNATASPLQKPYKANPCGDCRALRGGLCQCAVKKIA